MEQKERMDQGLIYDPADNRISTEQTSCLDAQYEFNATRPSEMKKRAALLKQMLGAIGENCYIEPPFRANWGGKHVYMGNNVYANFNLTVVDDGNIYIGDNVMFGPNVTIATANHPILPELREKGLQYNKDVHIGKNVWIGAGVVIVPGIMAKPDPDADYVDDDEDYGYDPEFEDDDEDRCCTLLVCTLSRSK